MLFVHSQTLPDVSSTPYGLAPVGKLPIFMVAIVTFFPSASLHFFQSFAIMHWERPGAPNGAPSRLRSGAAVTWRLPR